MFHYKSYRWKKEKSIGLMGVFKDEQYSYHILYFIFIQLIKELLRVFAVFIAKHIKNLPAFILQRG